MHEAIAQTDEDGRYHEYEKILVSEQDIKSLSQEAEGCIGEELIILGPTKVEVGSTSQANDVTADPDPGDPAIETGADSDSGGSGAGGTSTSTSDGGGDGGDPGVDIDFEPPAFSSPT